jgi:hypothetical protein
MNNCWIMSEILAREINFSVKRHLGGTLLDKL